MKNTVLRDMVEEGGLGRRKHHQYNKIKLEEANDPAKRKKLVRSFCVRRREYK